MAGKLKVVWGYVALGKSLKVQCGKCCAVYEVTNEPEDWVQQSPDEYPDSKLRRVRFCTFCGSREVFERG